MKQEISPSVTLTTHKPQTMDLLYLHIDHDRRTQSCMELYSDGIIFCVGVTNSSVCHIILTWSF
jgi:hypothetical protein